MKVNLGVIRDLKSTLGIVSSHYLEGVSQWKEVITPSISAPTFRATLSYVSRDKLNR
jgi:hypothetical protein